MEKKIYPKSGKPDTIKLEVNGSVPSKQEAEDLTKIKFERVSVSSPEVKHALKHCFINFGCAILLFIAAIFVPTLFFLFNTLLYICAVGFIILSIKNLLLIFRSARKKEAFEAMKWIWITSIIGEDSAGTRFGKPEFSISTINRIIPSAVSVSKEKIAAYIAQTREVIAKAADMTTAPMQKDHPTWKPAKPIVELILKEEQDIAANSKQLYATLMFSDRLTEKLSNGNLQTVVTAELEIDIRQTFIRAQGYWFPYDVTPPIRICEPVVEATASVEPVE